MSKFVQGPRGCKFPDCDCKLGCAADESYLGDVPWWTWLLAIGSSLMLFSGVALLVRSCT